jgi:hypothetical protein
MTVLMVSLRSTSGRRWRSAGHPRPGRTMEVQP